MIFEVTNDFRYKNMEVKKSRLMGSQLKFTFQNPCDQMLGLFLSDFLT